MRSAFSGACRLAGFLTVATVAAASAPHKPDRPEPRRPHRLTVQLVTPRDGASLPAPGRIVLRAVLADPGNRVRRIAFYREEACVGRDEAPPYACVIRELPLGRHRFRVVALDHHNAMLAESEVVTVTVGTDGADTLPLIANFEPAEGYVTGALDGQQGWTASTEVEVVPAPVYAGTQAISLAPAAKPAVAERALTAAGLVYYDAFLRTAAGSTPETAAQWRAGATGLALVRRGDRDVIHVLVGDGAGGTQWRETAVSIPLDASGAATWQRYTMRANATTRTWDFYANGAMRAANLAFAGTGLPGVRVVGHPTAPTGFDDLLAATENPLFVDADNDGMEDAWEAAHGLDVTRDDRDADADADGLTNITEYVLGTDPAHIDSDRDGMPDGWEANHGSDPATNDAAGDPDHDGVGNLVEYLQGRHPLRGVVADASGRVSLRVFQPGS